MSRTFTSTSDLKKLDQFNGVHVCVIYLSRGILHVLAVSRPRLFAIAQHRQSDMYIFVSFVHDELAIDFLCKHKVENERSKNS